MPPDSPGAAQDPGAAVPEVRAGSDALLQSLVWLCAHYGRPRSAQSLLSGLGIAQMLTPPLAVRVLEEAGFNAAVVERAPSDIHNLLLPVVLLLKNGDACVLTGRSGSGRQLKYRLLMPAHEAGESPLELLASEPELLLEYSGYALIGTPRLDAQGLHSHGPDDELLGGGDGRYWLWGTLKRFFPYYRGAMLAALLSNVLLIFIGMFTSVVYNQVIPHQALVTMWSLAIGVMMAIGFDLMARKLRSYLIDLAGKKADLVIGAALFRKTLGVRLESRPASSGSFAHHLSQLEVVRDFSASATMSVVSDLPFAILFVAMIWIMGGDLVWVMLIAIPIIIIMTVGIQSMLRRTMMAHHQHSADMHGLLIESVEGMEAVRVAGAQGYFQHQYDTANAMSAQSSLKARSMSSWVGNLSTTMQQAVNLAMLITGVYLIHQGKLSNGALVTSVMFAQRAIAPLTSMVGLAARYQGARAALRMLDQLMAQPSEREPGKRYLPTPTLAGHLNLQGVSFRYPRVEGDLELSEPPEVLSGLNLRIRAGERVAILGKIGSGKSTALRLLAGLYLPTDGAVEVDGIDLRQIDPSDYRAQVGFVSQEPRLFRGSLRDNILLGRINADPVKLATVCALTGLDRIAAAHPAGMDMPVGESGAMLSGGQRQLVALARCLVTQPRVLLMDEPTSSMDAQTEVQFLQHLKTLMGDRTMVMVTHRPAVLDLVERIIVLDAGKVIIDGPKQQVLAALSGQRPAAPAQAQRGGLSVVQQAG
ncbi:MAG: type I secretion system permease/ATPase [Burkholderiales bacterium]